MTILLRGGVLTPTPADPILFVKDDEKSPSKRYDLVIW
jgi:hypothetical protein